ncbi:MAG: GtrA family protein [Clostridia bacterium]|nr:GtrA family protein [Clostridia bacterium]
MKRLLSLLDGKLLKFLVVGVINTLVGTAIMFGLYNLAGCSYWFSSAANYLLTSILSYFLNKYFTFKNAEKGWRPIVRFAVNIAVCYLLAYGIAEPLVRWALTGASPTVQDNVAMLVGMCLFTGFNYLGQRLFAFREKN